MSKPNNMKLLSLLIILPTSVLASVPANKNCTAEQLRALKPPLHAQHYTLKPKPKPLHPHSCWPPSSMPPLDLNHALAAIPEVQSPSSSRKKKLSRTPKNSIDLSRLSKSDPNQILRAAAAKVMPPFPEIVITFEALK